MKKINLSFFVILILLSFVSAHTGNDAFDHYTGFCPMMSGQFGFGWMVFGWLTTLLIIAVLVLFVIYLIKQIKKK